MRTTLLLAIAPLALWAQTVRPVNLRCEYRANPLGIDVARPRLSWELAARQAGARGLRQSAYRVLVASSDALLQAGKGDLWDSGRVESAQSIHVVYGGAPLAAGARAAWKVRVWDQAGGVSESAPAFWSAGITEWKAAWIGRDEDKLLRDPASPYHLLTGARWIWARTDDEGPHVFRANLAIPAGRKIRSAVLMAGSDSGCEISIGDQAPAKCGSVHMPDVHDIAASLRAGDNAIAVRAARRRNAKSAGLIAAVKVELEDGSSVTLRSGPAWRVDGGEARDLGAYGVAPWGEVGFKEERLLPARMLRKEFDVARGVKRATAYVSGLGTSELYLNGAKVGDHVLSPGLTDYEKRVFYVTHDVTRLLAAGRNAVGVWLGNGRFWAPRALVPTGMRSFGYPKARVQIEIEYADGGRDMVVTDTSWKLTAGGPILANNEFDGEQYDARREMAGWSRAGYKDAAWEQARAVDAPAGAMVAQMAEPLRVTETVKAKSVKEIAPGVFIYDLGQNLVGWCRLRATAPKGARITLRHAETLRPDGSLYLDNLRSARATDVYIAKGGGVEVWEPRFTYHGFRFVEVRGLPGKPGLSAIEGRVVHDAMTPAGEFASSNDLLNRIHSAIRWGMRGNYRSIPTDCPQRDERQGWLGDRSQVSRSETYVHDVAAFYSKWMTDLSDSQRPTGSIPNVAPAYWVLYSDNVTWPSTFIYVPGMLYEQYGDVRAIEVHYAAMKKWIDYMKGFLKDDLMPRDTYGDWCVPPESPTLIHSKDPARKTDGVLLGTAYYYDLLRLMARYARLAGKAADSSEYEALAARVKAAFHRKFFDASQGVYGNGTQTSSILPLAFGIAPEAERARVFGNLIRRIEQESKGHVGTGLVGAQWLMRTLSLNGRADVAYEIAGQKSYPGWGYMIEKGATTIWELWNGDTADPAMNSGNHVMQIGDLGVWLFEYLAGIRGDPEQPGFHRALIRPYPVSGLQWVKASHHGMYGRIETQWRRDAAGLALTLTVPPNSTAAVWVPAKSPEAVLESGRPASQAKGVKFLRMDAGAAVFEVESGSYAFLAK
jgi:alpha-L-rhamnosidase